MALSPVTSIWFNLFMLYTVTGLIIDIFVVAIFIYFLLKYRSGPKEVRYEEDVFNKYLKEEDESKDRGGKVIFLFMISVAIILYTLAFNAAMSMEYIETVPEDSNPIVIKVEAFQWGWRFIYPDGSTSVNVVEVPVGKVVVFEVVSLDVHHKFGIPELKSSIDAVPGRTNILWIRVDAPGEYDIRCYELCGVGHSFMKGKLVVTGGGG